VKGLFIISQNSCWPENYLREDSYPKNQEP